VESYKPLPQFLNPGGKLTLLFISSIDIAYPAPSYDKIFPATDPLDSGSSLTYWFNNSTHASVLGCVDESIMHDPRTGQSWNLETVLKETDLWNQYRLKRYNGTTPLTTHHSNNDMRTSFLALALSLTASTIYDAVANRKASSLNVQGRLQGILSTKLDLYQWHVEVRKMFRTSLARAQIEMVDIANGAWAHMDGFENALAPNQMALCDIVQVRAPGYKSMSLGGLLLVLGICLLVTVLSINPRGDLVVVRCGYFISKQIGLKSVEWTKSLWQKVVKPILSWFDPMLSWFDNIITQAIRIRQGWTGL